ncbi:MAG: spore maturation protein [Ruminococcus sp.]|uniref:spore maturation protein n=1 Tax=Ruminococcus sp. TaxID=41978 RepID=UPI0025DAE513|nr:nucleoside recognition domain-containing protein [Ruminococcus sp.]MCI6616131.1 spore maturation protein [Ruminococcus sp.]
MEFVMPAFACIIVVFGLIKRVPVFDIFLKGAKEGMQILYSIAPTIIGLVFAVDLLRSSGAIDAICNFIEPVADYLGFPKEIVPMVLLRPVSGSGSTALLTSLYEQCGPDSFAGRVASVLAGSSETTFYAIAMYFGCIKVKKIRHTLFAAIIADITAAVMSVLTVRLYFGMS